MKLKTILFLLLVVCFTTTQAQVEKPIPTEAQWQAYFYAKEASIKKKLYQLVLDGKIKAYKNDSFVSTYGLDYLKLRGSTEKTVNLKGKDTIINVPLKFEALNEFWFCKEISSSPFEETESNHFVALAITFQPSYGGFTTRNQPFCWMTINDLKVVLSKEDYQWLQLLFFYSKNDNTILFRSDDWDDNYWELNHVKLFKNITHSDSLLFQKLSRSLNLSSFYFESFWWEDKNANDANIYDQQQKKNISYFDFQLKYQEKLTVFLQTDVNNPAIGKDTVISSSRFLENVTSITFDKVSNRIKTFNFELKEAMNSPKILRFSVDADIIRKTETLPTLFWFFEDFYQWTH